MFLAFDKIRVGKKCTCMDTETDREEQATMNKDKTRIKSIGTGQRVMYAQELAAMDDQSIAYQARCDEIQCATNERDYGLVRSIEAVRRRRDAGIVDGWITQSFGTGFKKG